MNKFFSFLEKIFMRTDGKRDYCTCSPDVLFGVDIGGCCKLHDENYEKGIDKAQADRQLREDIEITFAEQGKPLIGKFVSFIYYWAVVKFGKQ